MDNEIRYMIVEDQDIVSLGLRISLEEFSALKLVGIAKDGEQAVEMALALKPDLIIMDLGLPRLDGIEATRKICQMQPHVKVLIMSSREKARDIFACFAAGASGYCRKEASANDVYAAMQALMKGQLTIEAEIAGRILACLRDVQTYPSMGVQGGSPILSEMELQIISLTADGLNNNTIAAKLGMSPESLTEHKQQLRDNLATLGSLLSEPNDKT